jgi:zinc and cadmium transporter
MSPILATFISVALVSLISLAGIAVVYMQGQRTKRILFVLISFAVGTLLGDVFFHIFPEIFSEATDEAAVFSASAFVLAGLLIFFALEHFLHWRHCHYSAESDHPVHPVGYTNLAADGLHNFIDGLIIGASFMVSMPVGIATTLAVLFHEIPQELGDFGVLVHAGFSKTKALLFNFLTALLAILGGAIALWIGTLSEEFSVSLAALAAGGFLYIAATDLLPELHKDVSTKKSLAQFAAVVAGLGIMFLLTALE